MRERLKWTGLVASVLVTLCNSRGARAEGRELFAAPDGTPSGDGSRTRPWDIATALSGPAGIGPGDTLLLRGGTYTGPHEIARDTGCVFTSRLRGTPEHPIVVAGMPGEDVVLDAGAPGGMGAVPGLCIQEPDVTFRDFRLTSLFDETRHGEDSPFPPSLRRASGVMPYADRIKLINLVIDNTTIGITSYRLARGLEVYGCVVFNNGFLGDVGTSTPNAHGHNVYVQNTNGAPLKLFRDNVLVTPFENNVQAYGSSDAELVALRFEGNVMIGAGPVPSGAGNGRIIVGGRGTTAGDDVHIVGNYQYRSGLVIGYLENTMQDRIEAVNNYVVGQVAARYWRRVTFTGNTIVQPDSLASVTLSGPAGYGCTGTPYPAWMWNENTYFGGEGFTINGCGVPERPIETWRMSTGWDATSQVNGTLPSENVVAVTPNLYSDDRAHVVIYNWEGRTQLRVPVPSLVARGWHAGDTIAVHSAQDYVGDVSHVTFDGEGLDFDMHAGVHSVAAPHGWGEPLGNDTFPQFGAFVLVRTHRAEPVVQDAGTIAPHDGGATLADGSVSADASRERDASLAAPTTGKASCSCRVPARASSSATSAWCFVGGAFAFVVWRMRFARRRGKGRGASAR